jgi:hypothetical protein
MSNQLQITGGAKVRNLDGVITGSTGVLNSLPINGANGIPQLDSNGKILVSQLPNSVMEYKGMWNVATNTPYLVNGTGNAGDVYLVTGAATTGTAHDFGAGSITFFNGDQVIYDGTNWDRASGATGTVTSVAVSESSAALNITGSPITTSGTINIGFAGTSAQYVAGDGSLITFPSLSGYVPYTGATSDVDLGSHKLSLYSEQFASISAPSYSEGALWYDSTQKALAYYNDISGNILHIGQEVQLKVHNNTGATIAKGAPVYVTSTSSGYSYPNVALAKADTLTTANVIGLANQAIATGTDGYITLSGLLTGANTGSFTVGDVLYLSPYSAGQLMNTMPPTGYAVRVGVVSYSNTPNGTIYINQSNAFSTAANIVGTIQISQGGTGATTASGALTNLGAAADNAVVHLAGTETITGDKTFNGSVDFNNSTYLNSSVFFRNNAVGSTLYTNFSILKSGSLETLNYLFTTGNSSKLVFNDAANYTYTFPSATGIIALTSDIPSLTGYVPYTGATSSVDLGNYSFTANTIFVNSGGASSGVVLLKQGSGFVTNTGYTTIGADTTNNFYIISNVSTVQRSATFNLGSITASATRTYTLPDASGTLALLENDQTFSGNKIFSGIVMSTTNYRVQQNSSLSAAPSGYVNIGAVNTKLAYSIGITSSTTKSFYLETSGLTDNTLRTYTLPDASGTIALVGGSGVGTVTSVGLSSSTTGVTIGSSPVTTSGTIILSIATASGSQQGLLSSTDWNTFNGKQNALGFTPIGGTGTTNYHAKWTASGVLGNSLIYDNGTNVGIGQTSPSYNLDVTGTGRFTGNLISSTNILVGTTTVGDKLTVVNSGSYAALQIGNGTNSSFFGYANASGNYNNGASSGDAIIRGYSGVSISGNNGSSTNLYINSSGNVGIGTSSPSKKLHISATVNGVFEGMLLENTASSSYALYQCKTGSSGVWQWGVWNDNGYRVGISGVADYFTINSGGYIILSSLVYGNTVSSSPRTLYIDSVGGLGGISSIRASKTNIQDISNVNWLNQLNPVSFNYRKKDEEGNYLDEAYEDLNYGLIAEDTEPIAEFLINYRIKEDGTKEMAGIEYSRLITPMLKAIQELSAEVNELKALINK